MTSQPSKIGRLFLQALIPILCSILLGFILFGADVFTPSNSTYQFVLTPVIASIFYFLLVLGNQRNAYAGLFVLFVLTLFMTHSTSGGAIYIVRDILYFAAIAGAIYLYFKYFSKHAHLNAFYSAITLAGLYAATYVVTSEINLAIVRLLVSGALPETVVSMATTAAFFGVFIGFAVGGGIMIAEKLFGAK
jgi:hypothetical protein